MYREYWNLQKAPFDNVPDPSMYAECHVSMENVISETIYAIKEGNECFAVIIGDAGMGKTLSLRIIMDALEPQKYKVVLITNPAISFPQLLKEIIGQVTGKQCDLKNKYTLLEIFNRLIFEAVDAGLKIIIFIDEANSISPANLENLRLLTNMQDDQHNLFTLVLAGQMELAQRLEHPKRANLFQRIGTYGRIDKLPSESALKTYIETRLKLAGAGRKIFTDDCLPVIWNYSENGVPRLINKICKLCLKAGETNEFRSITPDIVTQTAERFQKLSQTAYQKRKPRSRLDVEFTDDEISAMIDIDQFKDLTNLATSFFEQEETSAPPSDVVASNTNDDALDAAPWIEEDVVIESYPEDADQINALEEKCFTEANTFASKRPSGTLDEEKTQDSPAIGVNLQEDKSPAQAANEANPNEDRDELVIGGHVIELNIPKSILKQVRSFNPESANKSAGFWAAQIIKNNPALTKSSDVDPVHLWHEIKNNILSKINV
jgi:general secretion pathway protein A